MGVERIFEKEESDCVYAPLEGKIVPIEEVPDKVFSEGIMGKGCGIKPSEGKVYAPFDGEVVMITKAKHSIALKSYNGIELLIHIGIDTVNMSGKGFIPSVKVGDSVKCGQLIMEFSISDIEAAGYMTTTAVVVANSQEYANIQVLTQGNVKRLEKIICLL